MINSEKLSVAALISVILRRKINRTIDVKWLVTNDAYAQEIIKLCREQAQDDLTEYADRLDQLTFGKSSAPAPSFARTGRPAADYQDLAGDIRMWISHRRVKRFHRAFSRASKLKMRR